MIFSKLHFRNQKVLIVLLLTVIQFCYSQKSQRIAYIDMEYILENVPQYRKAQQSLNDKVIKWRSELDKMSREIEKLKTELSNEREILTQAIIVEKEDLIELKQNELRKLEQKYFGPEGDMFVFRKRIIYPVQDVVYNAVEEIAKRNKYDFVLDKSSDLIMLYSNKKYDISELVLRTIVVDRKRQDIIDLREKKAANNGLSDAQKKKVQDRLEAENKKKEQVAAQKKKIQEARAKRKAEIEAKRELLRKKKAEANKKKEDDDKKQE